VLVASVAANGKRLDPVAETGAEELATFLKRMAELVLGEKTNWTLESVGEKNAADHELAPLLKQAGFQVHGEKLILWKH
jgi:hypothetical protein